MRIIPAQSGFLNLGIATIIPGVLRELGSDPAPILNDAGLSYHLRKDRTYRLSVSALGALLRLCAKRAHCPHFGLLVGQRITLSALGDLGSLMKASETLGDALQVLVTYRRLQSNGAVFHLDKNGDQAVLSYLPYKGGPGTELIAECALAIITRILCDLCGPEWALAEVSMPRRAPADRSPYQSCFRSDVRFDRDTAALVFPARLSSARLKGSDAAARCALKHSLQTVETNIDLDLIEDLRQVLRAELVSGRSSAADLARCYGIHKRTLGRHLKAAGTSFKTVANGVRFEVARHLVADTDIPLAQISAALDFSEPAAFTRAFQRWLGTSPSRLRSQQKVA